jgi:hypothetical protein
VYPERENEVVFSPTHKRTEGRAPVWGSEFTSKDATLQEGSSRNRCWAERKIVDFGACLPRRELPLIEPIPLLNLFESSRSILNLCPKNLSRDFWPVSLGRVKWYHFCEGRSASSPR